MTESPRTLDPVTRSQHQQENGSWRQGILRWLEAHVPIARLDHILRVEQMSTALAKQHGLNINQAAQAGLLHDLAKYFKPQRLLEIAQAEGLELDPILMAHPHLLHADVSAVVARDEFGIQDEEILQAIRNHTLGCPEMNLLSCVVYLADALEPGRGDHPTLNALRQVSQENLHRAVWLTAEASLQYLFGTRQLIHPRTILTRNWSMQLVTTEQSRPQKDIVVNG
jgi:predicted HD superfamily hydrolase involved in NAD metabolism